VLRFACTDFHIVVFTLYHFLETVLQISNCRFAAVHNPGVSRVITRNQERNMPPQDLWLVKRFAILSDRGAPAAGHQASKYGKHPDHTRSYSNPYECSPECYTSGARASHAHSRRGELRRNRTGADKHELSNKASLRVYVFLRVWKVSSRAIWRASCTL